MSISDERLAALLAAFDDSRPHEHVASAAEVRAALTELQSLRAAAKVRAIREGDGEALSLNGFAETLTSTMEARSITVRGLSETLGIDKSAISRMRTGKPVEARHFIAMWNWVAATPAATGGEKE